jgi:hypothetical protein
VIYDETLRSSMMVFVMMFVFVIELDGRMIVTAYQ